MNQILKRQTSRSHYGSKAPVLKEYIQRTEKLRKSQKLFVTYTKPYNQPAISTLSNWIKLVLQLVGVNVKLFKTHITRSPSTSGVAVNTILKSAGWTNESIFRKFYNRLVTVQGYNENYSVRLLCGQEDKWCHYVFIASNNIYVNSLIKISVVLFDYYNI